MKTNASSYECKNCFPVRDDCRVLCTKRVDRARAIKDILRIGKSENGVSNSSLTLGSEEMAFLCAQENVSIFLYFDIFCIRTYWLFSCFKFLCLYHLVAHFFKVGVLRYIFIFFSFLSCLLRLSF